MKQNSFKGIFPALITPFDKEGRVDYEKLLAVVDYTKKKGADGYFVTGTTSEFLCLTSEEKKKIIKTVCEAVKGELKTVIQIGGGSLSRRVRLAEYSDVGRQQAAISSILPSTTLIDEQIKNIIIS